MLYHLYDTSPLTMTFHSAPRFWSSEPPSAPQYTPGVSTGSEESLICCIPLLLTPNEVAFIILHFLAGITQAGLFIIIPVYVKEISPKQSRGSMVSLMMMLIPLGYLSRLVLNKEEMMYTMTALVLMELVSVFLVIESPSYLVKAEILRLVHIHTIKYFEDLMGVHALFYTFAGINLLAAVYCVMAVPDIKDKSTKQIEQQLKRIPILKITHRLWNSNSKDNPLPSIFIDQKAKINIAKLKCLTEEDSSVLNELNRLRDESERAKSNGNLTILRILQNKIWLDSMKIGFVLYSNKTLIQLKTQTNPKNILIPLSMFTGGTTTVVLINFFERKYLLTFGYALMVVSMGVVAVFTQADLTVTSTRWLPVTSLGILVFAYGMVWALPIDLMGVHALFYTFAGINLLAVVYCLMAVPDIKDKTTKQIEQQLKRIPILKM
ncbi:unnamed protein product, partial [Leptidea sinapis]